MSTIVNVAPGIPAMTREDIEAMLRRQRAILISHGRKPECVVLSRAAWALFGLAEEFEGLPLVLTKAWHTSYALVLAEAAS